MKREALNHPKMLDLAARLRISREWAIGIVTVLIDWTHDMAPQGDIGKWPNGAISVACGWSGDPDEFIGALVAARWLDTDQVHRLLVHDYPDHAERFVKAKLARNRQWFCGAYYQHGRTWDAPAGIAPPGANGSGKHLSTTVDTTGPPDATAVATTVRPTGRSPPRDQTNPNQTKPNHPQTPGKNPPAERTSSGLVVAGGWECVSWGEAEEALRKTGYKRTAILLRECQAGGRTPQEMLDACAVYLANATKFSGPGAIAEYFRSGYWPANGVSEPKVNGHDREKRQRVIDGLRRQLLKLDNEAREWTEKQVLEQAKAKGMIA